MSQSEKIEWATTGLRIASELWEWVWHFLSRSKEKKG